MNINELAKSNKPIILEEFPLEWKASFISSLFGKTISIEDGRHIVPFRDFVMWYYSNKEQIDRDEKLKEILK